MSMAKLMASKCYLGTNVRTVDHARFCFTPNGAQQCTRHLFLRRPPLRPSSLQWRSTCKRMHAIEIGAPAIEIGAPACISRSPLWRLAVTGRGGRTTRHWLASERNDHWLMTGKGRVLAQGQGARLPSPLPTAACCARLSPLRWFTAE
jgi:hypothetical protein